MEARIKTGGRVKGSLNKTTAETKELIQNIVSKELETIPGLLAQLDPVDRVTAIIKLLPYLLPKQQDIAIEVKEPTKILISVKKRENHLQHCFKELNELDE